jgi:hypothetical protein
MYFVAIALAVSLFLGGGAVVATNTTAGEKAVTAVSGTWSEVKAGAESYFNADAEGYVDADAEVDASTALEVNVF